MADSDKKASALKYHGRVFDVYEEDVVLPNGRTSRLSRIDHGATITAVPVDAKGNLILLRQYRHAVGKYLIEIPAGNMDKNETPEECALRELQEEIGYGAKRLVKLYEGYLVPGYCNEYMYFYLALDLYDSHKAADEDEIIEKFTVSFEEAFAMLGRGEIEDSKTALGLCLAERYFKLSGC